MGWKAPLLSHLELGIQAGREPNFITANSLCQKWRRKRVSCCQSATDPTAKSSDFLAEDIRH